MMVSPAEMSRGGHFIDGSIDPQKIKSMDEELKRLKKKMDSLLSLI